MKQADPKGSPERLVHYLEMATKAQDAARNPAADVQVRNLYTWVAKSWEMLAVDELEKLRSERREKSQRKRGASPSHARARQDWHAR